MNNQSNGMGFVIGVLVVIVIGVVGFLAYKQGYFQGKTQDSNGIEIKLTGDSNGDANQ